MLRKLLILGLVLLMSSVAFGGRFTQKQIQFVNEWGDDVNMGTSVSLYIYDTGGTTEQTCYLDSAGSLLVTQAVEDDSANTPLDYGSGLMTFWSGKAAYKLTVTDGTYTRTLDNLTGSDTRMMWPTFLVALSSYNLGISEDLDFTFGEWVLDGDTAGTLDIIPDAADGVLNIGTSASTTQGDVYIYASSTEYLFFNQDVAELNLTHIDQIVDDDSTLYFGDGKDISFKWHNTNSDLDITGDGLTFTIGATGAGLDVIIWGQTGNFVYFDETNDRTFFEDWDLRINEGGLIEYADTNDAVDWTIKVATAEQLEFLPTETTDDQKFYVGDADHTADFKVFSKTASEFFLWDASLDYLHVVGDKTLMTMTGSTVPWRVDCTTQVSSGNAIEIETSDGTIQLLADGSTYGDITLDAEDDITFTAAGDLQVNVTGTLKYGVDGTDVPFIWYAEATGAEVTATGDFWIFDGIDINMMDADFINFGDDIDWKVSSPSATRLDFIPLTTDETSAIYVGAASAGADVKIFGTDAGDYWEWDASADLQTIVGDAVAWTLTEAATTAVNIDITGTNGGFDLDTTDGPVALTAGGGTNGDMTLTVGDDFTLAVTGDTILPNDVLLKATVELTAADMNTLASSPAEILASPAGTDLTYEFVSAILALNYGGNAWTEPTAPDDLCFRYTDGSGAILSMLIDATGFATATADTIVFVAPVADIVAGTTAAVGIAESASTDQSIVLDNTGGDWTGSGDSIVQVIIYYRIHTTAELGL